MAGKTKPAVILVEQHDDKETQDTVASIRSIAHSAWFAALDSRGLAKITLSEIEFEMWWKEKLAKAKMEPA